MHTCTYNVCDQRCLILKLNLTKHDGKLTAKLHVSLMETVYSGLFWIACLCAKESREQVEESLWIATVI